MSLCRVGAEAVSLALLAHLWIGVYAIHVPDSPGAGAHAREATGTMQHPYGKSIPQALPSFQAGHCWGEQKTHCTLSYCSPGSEAGPCCPGWSH